ncbi:MAG: hypothetical protein QXL94_06130 [Candidatus Parvarchaeum sp.]
MLSLEQKVAKARYLSEISNSGFASIERPESVTDEEEERARMSYRIRQQERKLYEAHLARVKAWEERRAKEAERFRESNESQDYVRQYRDVPVDPYRTRQEVDDLIERLKKK